ncbi:MAG: nucleotidyl transferase AbiEii/AbiGii toxin family protein [archaeon]
MKMTLFNKLKKNAHRKIALLQDELVDIVYNISDKAVFNGGTAIWRCYSGNRFSEDLDFYFRPEENFKKDFVLELNSRGLELLKYKKTENTVFAKISNGETIVRLELAFREKEHIVKTYEKADGTRINVFVLSPENLLSEKMSAYNNRKLIRDIYDVYFLSSIVTDVKINAKLKEFLKKPVKPVDEKNLKTIVFSGAIPSFQQMINSLKRGV